MELLVIIFWCFALSVFGVLAYIIGVGVGFKKGTARGLELAWQRVSDASEEVLADLDRRGREPAQTLTIRYSMRTGGGPGATPLTGRLVLPGLTRADWTKSSTHDEIRGKLNEAYPGCEIIGYAVLDRVGTPEFEPVEGGA